MTSLLNINNFGINATFHFVGIGGIGMSGIAEIMTNLGYDIQGSDMSNNQNVERLTKLGIKVFIGQEKDNITSNIDFVVISTSIKEDNPEYQAAIEKRIPVIRRAEMLAEVMRLKTCITISGSHGKTSTTSMMASMFEAASLEPTVINGGIINTKSTNAYLGSGKYLIVEADESDATFIKIPSSIGVITNIDPEHLDHYKNFENLLDAFRKYIENLPFYGFCAVCIDHENVRNLIQGITDRKIITYGIDSEDANVRAFNIRCGIFGSKFDVKINLPHSNIKYVIEDLHVTIPGKHNILNCLSTIAVATELDFGIKTIKKGLHDFKGVKRRFTLVHEENGVRYIDDYAHHPAEILATINTARSVIEGGKLITIFQPHRYTRLENLFDEFVESFKESDKILIADVFTAGEEKIKDYDSEKLTKSIAKKFPEKEVHLLSDFEDDLLKNIRDVKDGDLVLFMGAGTITNVANNVSNLIKG